MTFGFMNLGILDIEVVIHETGAVTPLPLSGFSHRAAQLPMLQKAGKNRCIACHSVSLSSLRDISAYLRFVPLRFLPKRKAGDL